jgi:hypothetical protein
MDTDVQKLESEKDPGTDSGGVAKRWIMEIKAAQKEDSSWIERANKVVQRYSDERDSDKSKLKRMNMLWSYTESQKPSVYSKTPTIQAERRFYDQDPISKVGSLLVERCGRFTLDDHPFDEVMFLCRDDYLLPGRGQAWVRYDATFAEDGVTIESERTVTDYIHWQDFLHSPARHWGEVRWGAKKLYFTRDECVKNFGEKHGKEVPLDFKPKNIDEKEMGPEHELYKKACVWEIWDKPSRKVYWVSTSYSTAVLKEQDDPLGLKDFFPFPKPLYVLTNGKSLVPAPEYCQWQDLSNQLDEIMVRRMLLTEALKVSGVYDSSCEGLQRLLSEGRENQLIPIPNWPQFAQAGGMTGAIQFLPIREIADTLRRLGEEAESVKREIYEVTGWSDIIRGTTNPNETLGAQELKNQNASIRLQEKRREMQRFVRDVVRIHAEIIAEHFSPETIATMAGLENLGEQDQMVFQAAHAMIKNDRFRSFRINIETDSTFSADEQQDRAGRIEFLQALPQIIQQMAQIANFVPQMLPFCGEAILFAARTFKQGKTLESTLEECIQGMQQHVQQAQEQKAQQPDPVMMEIQMQQQKAQAETEIKAQRAAQESELAAQKAGAQIQIDFAKAQNEMSLQRDKQNHELFIQARKQQADQAIAAQKALTNPRPG